MRIIPNLFQYLRSRNAQDLSITHSESRARGIALTTPAICSWFPKVQRCPQLCDGAELHCAHFCGITLIGSTFVPGSARPRHPRCLPLFVAGSAETYSGARRAEPPTQNKYAEKPSTKRRHDRSAHNRKRSRPRRTRDTRVPWTVKRGFVAVPAQFLHWRAPVLGTLHDTTLHWANILDGSTGACPLSDIPPPSRLAAVPSTDGDIHGISVKRHPTQGENRRKKRDEDPSQSAEVPWPFPSTWGRGATAVRGDHVHVGSDLASTTNDNVNGASARNPKRLSPNGR